MTKILVISNYNNETSSRPEAEIFIQLAKYPDFDITIMTFDGSIYAKKFKQAGIKVIDFHPVKKFSTKESRFIRNEIIRGTYQILHLFNSKSIINGLRAAKGLSVKVVIYRGYTGNIHWYDPTAYLKVLHPRVDKILCNSVSVKERIDRQLFFKQSKTIVITKGHSSDWYHEIVAADRTEFEINTDDFVVVTTGNDRKMKGYRYLLNAIELIPEDNKLKLLIIGGDDKFKQKYQKFLAKNKDKVIFTGFRRDNLQIVASADVFISSSIKGESFQKSVAEAMHLGICPVITNIAGNRGMVINNENGLVVPSKSTRAIADSLIYLYNHREKCKNMGQNAKRYMNENFRFTDTIAKYQKLYSDLLSDNSG